METPESSNERLGALENQIRALKRCLRWWRGIACGQTRRRRVCWSACLLVTALVVYALAPHPVQAKTFDCGAGDVQCLIAAINEANANGQKNTIRLNAGTYTLTAVDNITEGSPNERNGLPSITSTLILRGADPDTTIIERAANAPAFWLLHIAASGTLTLEGLTLQGGGASGAAGLPVSAVRACRIWARQRSRTAPSSTMPTSILSAVA